jgi:DNA-3-methyladenine glycosylase II
LVFQKPILPLHKFLLYNKAVCLGGDSLTDDVIKHFDKDSIEIQHLCQKDKRLAKMIELYGPLEYRIHSTPYEFMINTIMGQMLSNKVAYVMRERMNTICNGEITPTAVNKLSYDEIHDIGLSQQKTNYIISLTQEVISGNFSFDELGTLTDSEIIKKLTSLPGIGNWSAKMYLIFVLDRMNVLPYEDGAFLQAYKWLYGTSDTTTSSIQKRCKKWTPYSSLAARYLYRFLDCGFTKQKYKDIGGQE